MKKDSSDKKNKCQNQSLMALSSSVQGQLTKKAIQAQQIYTFEPMQDPNRTKYTFEIPLHLETAVVYSALLSRFSENVIHSEQSFSGGFILLRGMSVSGWKRLSHKICDILFCCCRPHGFKRGLLSDTYNIIWITIKKQVANSKYSLTISNPYAHSSQLYAQFQRVIVQGVHNQLKRIASNDIDGLAENSSIWQNPSLNPNAPNQLQIHIFKKVYTLLVGQGIKQHCQIKAKMDKALLNLDQQIERHRSYLEEKGSSNKKPAKGNPSMLIELLIRQTDALYFGMFASYQENEQHQGLYLQSLLKTQSEREITMYTIEHAICFHKIELFKNIYLASIKDECQTFNSECQLINTAYDNKQIFMYLMLKEKFWLPKVRMPYNSAIQALKNIEFCTSARQMLLVLQKTYSFIKTDCLTAYSGKTELASMDEILPIIIFVTARANVNNFPVYVRLVDDYIRLKGIFEHEQRRITNFAMAVADINSRWPINK